MPETCYIPVGTGDFSHKMLETYRDKEDTNFTKSSQRIYNFEETNVFVDTNKGLAPSIKEDCIVTIEGESEEKIFKIKNKIEKETGFNLKLKYKNGN